MRGHAVDRASIELIGMEGDRRWMVVDPQGQFKTIRQIPGMTRIDARLTEGGIKLHEASHGSIFVERPAHGVTRESGSGAIRFLRARQTPQQMHF